MEEKIVIAKDFIEFEDGAEYSAKEAMLTACDICGEWLEWGAEVKYDSLNDIQSCQLIAGSCGETFVLEPIAFRARKISGKSELL